MLPLHSLSKIHIALVTLVSTLAASSAGAQSTIDFDRQIRPLLSDNCFSCHGPDAAERQADLRLDRREDAVASGAFNDAQPASSLLLERILSSDPEKMMPPPKSNKQLSADQKQLLRSWVEQGANYTQHWAFLPPQRPKVLPAGHPIDGLIEQQLQREGLAFSPPADAHTLARRLSLDLTGLPPNEADVARLVAEPTPARIEEYIDQLMASPQYGERMSIGWLDVVRFADTIGYHSDTPRNVYPYRDYVIHSFNSNKPFDQFTLEQIAGDLLPDATQEQKIASCFNRLLLTTEEGGAQAKDYEARYLGDRVRAIGTTWLGLTIGCSQCHDHKFDPITMQDFYAMGAFFADIDEAIIGKREEGLPAPNAQEANKWQLLKVAVNTLQSELNAPHPQLAAAQSQWDQEQLELDKASTQWQSLSVSTATSTSGSTLTITPEQSLLARGTLPDQDVYQITSPVTAATSSLQALRLDVLPHASLPSAGSGRAGNGNFVLTEVTASVKRADGTLQPIKFAQARASHEQTQAADKHPDKRWSAASVIDDGAKGKQWGWAILPDVKQPHQLQLKLAEAIDLKNGDQLLVELHQQHTNPGHLLGHFRLSFSLNPLSYQAPLNDKAAAELLAIINTPLGNRQPDQELKLRSAFHQATPALADLRAQIAAAQKELSDFEAKLPKCLISKSLAKPRLVRILPRGNWQDESGPSVKPQLPGFLTTSLPPTDRPLNRLDLARWIVRPDHPLTARVFVNRLWKQFFGI
ncbi:MAG: DUF1549 domain-containing protein, partial [Pirellulaceae bacterium]|nr:DUF1549 domain-containing protein [Pirellulaceae bacterium]